MYKDENENIIISKKDFLDLLSFCSQDAPIVQTCYNLAQSCLTYALDEDNYFLVKYYEGVPYHLLEWTLQELEKVKQLFNKTKRINLSEREYVTRIQRGEHVVKLKDWELENFNWLITTHTHFGKNYLIISEDWFNLRPWTEEEFENIKNILNEKQV